MALTEHVSPPPRVSQTQNTVKTRGQSPAAPLLGSWRYGQEVRDHAGFDRWGITRTSALTVKLLAAG